ncbi:unnamed protein product [Schistosoma spindalis]|nr:unnamed protein product [Schistosoma spindale]
MEAEYGEVGEGVFEGETEAESAVEVFGETLGQVEADAESEAVEQVESERVSVFAPVELESEALAETAAQPERERLVERVGEMEAEYGEVGEGVFEGETEAESAVEVFGETLGQVEADAESEAVEQVESERVSVFAPVELESEALAETAAQPERERLGERVGEMEAEYGEVGEGVFEGETEAESAVEVFGETLGQVEADAESEAVEQVESERVSVFAPVELESEALAETAAQPERERLVERVGEMEAEYGEVGEGVFEGETEAESAVEVFGETLGQVEADAESEAVEQVESERVSVFAPVELESEALAETAAQPERERLVERVGEMEAEYGEVGEGVFEGETEAESAVEVFGETLGQVEADAESEAVEQVESERVSVFAPVELESEALAETAAQPERERLVERVGEMEAEYGEVGEGVFEGETEAESAVEVFGETLGQVEADAESEAVEQVESERVSVFAPVELESEALAETAAQPERERLVERVGEMEAEYGEVGEGVFEGETEAESAVEVFGETLGQVEADAESEAVEQVESERVSVFAPVELESEALAETAAQPERERLVERVGEMEAEYGEVGEGVFEGETEAESAVEVFGETLGQVEADAESEAVEQVESERVSVFAPVELESEALAETAAQPERERLVERVGEMEAEYGEVGEGVFEGETEAESAVEVFGETLGQVEADAESEAVEQVESERVSVFAPVELESEALAETAAQPERERLVERVGEMEAEYGEVGEGVFEGETEAESAVEVFGETLGQVEADAESEAVEQVESERVSVFAPVELESEALAETAAQPERERLVERVGEMEAEYGEVGEGVFEGETEAESAVEVFGETLGQVEADAESEAVEQVESERVSVFAPVELESEALAETAAQPERERLVERVGEMEAEYGEVGEGVFEGETEAESAVEVFGETLGQVEADAESEAVEQVESERVSVFAPVELESEALAETAAQPERERLVERVGEMEAEYGEVGEGVFEGETEAESAVEVFGETLGQVEADAESEAVEQVESERVSVFAPVELESEALAETAAQPERERLVDPLPGSDLDISDVRCLEFSSVGSLSSSSFFVCDSLPFVSLSDPPSNFCLESSYVLSDVCYVTSVSDCQPSTTSFVVSSCSEPPSYSRAVTICHGISSTPVDSFVLSNLSNDLSFSSPSSRFVHAGVSDFTRMPLDSVSLFDSNDSALVSEGLFLGLSQFVSRSTESFTEIPSFVVEDSVISVDAPDVCFTTYSGENFGESSDCRQAGISSVHDISAESVPFFIPEASVLAVSGYEYKSLDELGSSHRLPSIVQDTANVVDSHDIREVSEEGVIGKDSSISNDQMVLQTSDSYHSAFRCDPEYGISNYSNSLITDGFAEIIIEEPNHDTEILYSPKDQDALSHQLESGVSLVTEAPTKLDVLDKSSPSGKSDLTYLAAASGASVAIEFTEEEEEEDEFSMVCPGRMKTLEHGDSSQLVHSALDRSAKMLTRLQTYGFRGNLIGTNSLGNLNWHASETKLTTPCIEFFENDERTISLAHQNIPTSNVQMNKVTELDREGFEDFDDDSLEEFNIPFEICNTYNTSREIITDETECGSTSLFPIPEIVDKNQIFNYDHELKSDTDCQQEPFIKKEVSGRQHLHSELVISFQSSSTKKISFSPDHELQTSSTADESSLSSHSTIVNVGITNQSPVVPQLIRGNLVDEKLLSQSLSSQGHDFGVDAPDSIQLLESKTTLASIESDLDILDEEIKLKDDNAMLLLGRSSVHLSIVPKRKQSNFISNLLGSEPVVGTPALRSSTDVSDVPVSQPICTTEGHIKTTQRYFHEPIEGHVSFPQISEGSCDKQLEFSNDRAKSSPSSINLEKRIKTSDENVTSSSLSEFERLEKELGTSSSTSPSSGHKGSGEDVSSHTSSLSEYLRHEKECESFDEILALPFDSKIKLKFNDLMDINGKPKTDMLNSNNLTPLYGQISTIYEDVAEHHISSLSQSIESPTTSLHSAKDDDQISFTYSSQKDENKSQTGCSDSELLIICSKMLSDPLQAEKSKGSLTSSSEIEPLLDRVDDPLTGVEETDSLICSSIYDSLVPSGYENSIYDGTPNMNLGVNDNWRNRISRRIDSLDESEHEQPSKVTDSLCSPSSSDISNRIGENKLSPPGENDQGIIEFNSAHIDILHQQYIGTIVEKQSCTVFPNKSYFNKRDSSITYGKQPQSTHSDEKQDSSTSVSGVAQFEYLDKPVLGNCMTDSLDDSGSVIEQLSTKISSTECSATTKFVTTRIPSCSFSTAQIPLFATEAKALKYSKVTKTLKSDVSSTVEKVIVPTTSGSIALPISSSSLQSTYQDCEKCDNILKIDLNPQSTVFDTSEDDIFVKKPLNDLQQLNNLTTDDVSAVAVAPKTKETLKIDNIPSGEVSEACKRIKCKEFKQSFIVETSSDLDYEMVSITEREKSPIDFISEKMKKGNEQG